MKKILLLWMLVVSASGGFAQKFIIDDANAVARKVGRFSAISVSDAIDLYLTQADEEAMAVSAKDVEDRDRILAEVVNGTLRISFDKAGGKWQKGDKKLRAYVAFRTLTSLTASGASDVYAKGKMNGDSLDMEFSGASDFKGELEVKTLAVRLRGASDVAIKGRATVATIDASGASDFKAYDLAVDSCNVSANGASSVNITVNKQLNAKASGASDVSYKGAGKVGDVKSSGASSISRKG